MIAVDANVLMPLLREDALTKIAQSVRAADREWVMPSLLKIEVVNALLNEIKAGYLTLEGAVQAVGTAGELTAEARVQDPALKEILVTARQSGLTAYDATYVVLARSLGVRLVTEDKQILRACSDVARSMKQFLAPPEAPMVVRERPAAYKTARKGGKGAKA
jgi:predicted nucleic acid-binding protein